MKTSKLLITSLFAAAAMGADAFADTTTGTLLPELTSINRLGGGSTVTNGTYTDSVKIANDSINASNVAGDLKTNCTALQTQGWYWGIGQTKAPDSSNPYGNDVSKSETGTGFVFYSRPAYSGEYVAAAVDLSSLLGENAADMKTELSISFDIVGEAQIGGASFSIWSWDGSSDTATEIYKDTSAVTTTVRSVSVTTNPLLLGSGKLLVVWNAWKDGGGKTVTVSNLASSYTASTYSTLYWRGGDATWSTTSTAWNATSSETTGNIAATSFDDVVFDSDATIAVDSAGVAVDHFSVTGGTVAFSGGLITATGGVLVMNGATLALGGALTTSKISLDNGVLQSNATLALASNVSVETAGEIKVSSGTLTLNGAISGTGATLAKTGTGTLVVNRGASGKTLNIEAGTLEVNGSSTAANPLSFDDIVVKTGAVLHLDVQNVGDSNTLTWKKLTFEGGRFYVEDTQTNSNFLTITDVVMNGDGTIDSKWSNSSGTIGATVGTLSGNGNLTIKSATTEQLNWKTNQISSTYSGTIELIKSSKELSVSIGSSTAENANISVQNGIGLKLTGTDAYSLGTLTMGGGSATAAATLSIASSGVTLKGLSGTGAISLAAGTAASTLTVNQATNTTFAGTIADGIALKKAGAGTLILSGDNSAYTGTVTLEAGTLGVGHVNALGTSTVNVTGNATLEVESGLSVGNAVTVAADKKLTLKATGSTLNGAISGDGSLKVETMYYGYLGSDEVVTLAGGNTLAGTLEVEGVKLNVSALGTGTLKITDYSNTSFGSALTARGSVNAAAADVVLHNVSLLANNSAQLTADTDCNFTVAAGATLYLDIGLLTEATLTGDEVALTIAAASAFDNSFFSAVEVGTYGEDGSWVKDLQWAYVEGSWNVDAGTLFIAIPEPSVFGLLAGLGALALAGTRRRRKKA